MTPPMAHWWGYEPTNGPCVWGHLGSVGFLGIAASATGFVLWAYTLARLDVGRVTTGLYLVPAVAILVSQVWLGQVPGPIELVGGGIALAGVVWASTGQGRPTAVRPQGAAAVPSSACGHGQSRVSDSDAATSSSTPRSRSMLRPKTAKTSA